MRLKPVLAAISVLVLFGAVGCSKSDTPKEVASSATTADVSDTTEAEPDCPTQLIVDTVNEEFANLSSGQEADVEGAMETMGEYVPSDLQGDFETWQAAALEVVDLLDGIDPTKSEDELTASEAADLADAQDVMKEPAVDEAQDNVKDYFREQCPDIVWSEESDSTTTTELASGGDCPTAEEASQIEAIGESLVTIDDASIASVLAVYALLQTYVPADLQDEFDTTIGGLTIAFAQVNGLTFAEVNDPSTLSPEDQARVEAYLATIQDPEINAAGTAIDDYFEETCPDFDF